MKELLIFSILCCISCKVSKKNEIFNNDITPQDLLRQDYYFYSLSNKTPHILPPQIGITTNNKENQLISQEFEGYFSNIKPSKRNVPINIFTKEMKYFVEELKGKYEFYYINNNKVKMYIVDVTNEYAKDEKLESLDDVYNYLSRKRIPYRVLKEKQSTKEGYAELLLKNSAFCKVVVNKNNFITNIYPNIKDTLSSIQYGPIYYFYRNE